ncbi:hypothetical protein C8F01DRAFT_1132374 [Mycena amicta]|nr:hypothetical protein C8F01DRAFT_1132374 [Mycena amicta]
MLKQSPSPLAKQQRLSVFVDPYDSPSQISPLLEELTPSPFQQSPESLSRHSSIHEPVPAPRTARPQSFFHTSPGPRMPRPRPQSYGGALTMETLELVLDFESRIAEMESGHSRLRAELEEARDALNSERAAKRSSHRFSTLSHARFSSISSSTSGSDGPGDALNDIEYERRLRTELQDTLKKIRAQNDTIARSLRQNEETCSSLKAALEDECSARKVAEEAVARLSALNLTLFEHNKLLAGRDTALQEDISALMSKAQAEECMRTVLEAELQRRTAPPPIETSSEGFSTDDLSSAREELQIATERLSNVEEECAVLRERVSTLQQQLVVVVDSSSKSLEVERELRSDMEQRAQILADENTSLKARLDSLEEAFPNGHAPDAWIKRSPSKRRPISGRLDKRIVLNLKLDTTDRILERYRHVATSKKYPVAAAPAISTTTPALSTFTIPTTSPINAVPPGSPESACSTKVASPAPSQRAAKRAPRMSVIVAATLSKNRPQGSMFKANSSIFVDINSRIDEPMPQVVQHLSPAKPKRDLRTFILWRTSSIFGDIDELAETGVENIV